MKPKMFYLAFGLFLVILIGALSSCGGKRSNIGADGYYFEEESFTRLQTNVNVVLVKNQSEMQKLIDEHPQKIIPGRQILAFSVLSMKESSCTIYMIDPKVNYQPELIGHEFTHCLYGKWHVKQP